MANTALYLPMHMIQVPYISYIPTWCILHFIYLISSHRLSDFYRLTETFFPPLPAIGTSVTEFNAAAAAKSAAMVMI